MLVQDEGIEPDVVTTTTLVKAQVAGGDMKGAVSTLIQMLKTSKLRDQLDAFPFNTVIQVLYKGCVWVIGGEKCNENMGVGLLIESLQGVEAPGTDGATTTYVVPC